MQPFLLLVHQKFKKVKEALVFSRTDVLQLKTMFEIPDWLNELPINKNDSCTDAIMHDNKVSNVSNNESDDLMSPFICEE